MNEDIGRISNNHTFTQRGKPTVQHWLLKLEMKREWFDKKVIRDDKNASSNGARHDHCILPDPNGRTKMKPHPIPPIVPFLPIKGTPLNSYTHPDARLGHLGIEAQCRAMRSFRMSTIKWSVHGSWNPNRGIGGISGGPRRTVGSKKWWEWRAGRWARHGTMIDKKRKEWTQELPASTLEMLHMASAAIETSTRMHLTKTGFPSPPPIIKVTQLSWSDHSITRKAGIMFHLQENPLLFIEPPENHFFIEFKMEFFIGKSILKWTYKFISFIGLLTLFLLFNFSKSLETSWKYSLHSRMFWRLRH